MTFAELVEFTRSYIIADQYADAYDDEMLHDALWLASVETAALLDIPRAVTTKTVGANAQAFALDGARKVITFSIGGFPGISVDMARVASLWDGGGNRPLKYFNFDPRRADQLAFSPPSPGGAALIEYVALLERPDPLDFEDSEPWNGLLAPYHALIAYKAGVELFRADERENEAGPLEAQLQTRLSEAAAFLGRTDVANLIIGPELRDDEGARG